MAMTSTIGKRRHLVAASTMVLLFAAGAAGCSAKEHPSVASAAPSSDAGQDSGVKYSQCMRDQGFSWFPDPGADGGLKVTIPHGTDQTRYAKAEQTCKPYLPTANQNGRLSADDVNKVRQTAQCIRDHGFPKYPDPDANGATHIDESAGISPDDPAFQTAMRECQKYMPPRRNGSGS